MKRFILLFFSTTFMLQIEANAQKYLGLSANFGNQLSFSPASEGLKRPIAASGNLFFLSQEKFGNSWVAQTSVQLGVLGYQLKIVPYDTLSNVNDASSFFDYSTLYGGVDVQVGKQISVKDKILTIAGGAGGTYYYSAFGGGSIGVFTKLNDGSNVDLFKARIDGEYKGLVGFARLSTSLQLNRFLVVGLGYTYHFSPLPIGSYEFYHTSTPSSGEISLRQSEINTTIMLKISNTKLKEKEALSSIENKGNFYLGVETSIAKDLYNIEDPGNNLLPYSLNNVPWGFNMRKDFKAPVFIEAGFVFKYYWEGIGFKGIPIMSGTNSDNSWLIPLRFGVYTNVYKSKIYFVPVIGYAVGISPSFDFADWSGKQWYSNTVIEYSYTKHSGVSRFFSLLQTGAELETLLYNKLLFSLSANYYSGFNTTTQFDITYTVNNSAPIAATVKSKGQFWNIGVGLKYSFGPLFSRK